MTIILSRRRVLAALGGAMAMRPFTARAQSAANIPTIGYMGAADASVDREWVAAFVQRLSERGWNEGRTITMINRWAEGHRERYPEILEEFVRRNVNVILTYSTPAVLAAKQKTSVIPIVFPSAGDPVATGLIASFVHPGGNVTGLSFQTTDTAGKRVQYLRQVCPDLRLLAILHDTHDPGSSAELRATQTAASELKLEIKTVGIQRMEELSSAIDGLKGQVDGLFVATSPDLQTRREIIGASALGARLPTVHSFRPYVDAGGLMSYGADFLRLWQRAADMVDQVLRGTKPADIPSEQPTIFELVVNLKTAKALGLTIAQSFLIHADVIIE
jgi:putative tryptophan/tyrosine transport system substrate-binding protein